MYKEIDLCQRTSERVVTCFPPPSPTKTQKLFGRMSFPEFYRTGSGRPKLELGKGEKRVNNMHPMSSVHPHVRTHTYTKVCEGFLSTLQKFMTLVKRSSFRYTVTESPFFLVVRRSLLVHSFVINCGNRIKISLFRNFLHGVLLTVWGVREDGDVSRGRW